MLKSKDMPSPTKADRLSVEDAARRAVGRIYGCCPERRNVRVGNAGAVHEFDIYAENVVIGGVSTSTLKTSGQNRNTGGTDRACHELLWLSLWSGCESRIHVLTDMPLAQWLYGRFNGVAFCHEISIYHYDAASDVLRKIGSLASHGEVQSAHCPPPCATNPGRTG